MLPTLALVVGVWGVLTAAAELVVNLLPLRRARGPLGERQSRPLAPRARGAAHAVLLFLCAWLAGAALAPGGFEQPRKAERLKDLRPEAVIHIRSRDLILLDADLIQAEANLAEAQALLDGQKADDAREPITAVMGSLRRARQFIGGE